MGAIICLQAIKPKVRKEKQGTKTENIGDWGEYAWKETIKAV